MTSLVDYYVNGFGSNSKVHSAEANGLKVECLMLNCNYEEYFPTWEDAQIGKEIHENGAS